MKNHPKNNYAFEIRFVDDKTVQVFDIAAKNKQEGSGLPTEYDQDEVLRGQLRYSKLLGSSPSTGRLGDDDDQPYEHTVVTKRSKNRRSIQRHTFFMMGGGGGGGESNLDYYCDDVESDDRIEAVKPTTFTNPRIKQSNSVAQTTSSPPSPKPSTVPISTPCLPQAAFISSSKHTSIITEQPSYFNHRENESIKKSESYQSNINMNQISPISSPPPPHATTAPEHIPLQHEPQKRVKQEYYTEDYTSMVMIDSNDCDSKKHIQRRESDIQESGKRSVSPKRSCCIIS